MSSTTLPQKICDLNKAIATTAYNNALGAMRTVGRSVATTVATSRVAGKTVVGQSRSVVERTSATVAAGAREVAGQAQAQGARVGATIDREANRVVDTAARKVAQQPASGTPYEQWTKAQLLERARATDVDGRATMNKAELVTALRG
jgi:hypothetical protein